MKKILVLGANGMAGHVITTYLSKDTQGFQVYSIARCNSIIQPTKLIDVTSFNVLENYISQLEPDVVINCVGVLNKMADEVQDIAILVNSYLPHFLKKITDGSKIKIIHISTDCVFSGKTGNYEENSIKDGTGSYAQSKSLGEICTAKDLTFRTSIIGPDLNINGIGLFNWFMKQNEPINGYSSAIWTGVTTIELAKAITFAIKQDLVGIYNLVNGSKISKFDLLLLLKSYFNDYLVINENSNYVVDKSLTCTRNDFEYVVPSYQQMIAEMKDWINYYQAFYPHYSSSK